MSEQDSERTKSNKLNAAEMFKLTQAIAARAESTIAQPADSWNHAEAVYSELIGRPVTRPNILTALTSLDDVDQSQVVRCRFSTRPGPDDHKLNDLHERVDAIDEVLAREAARIDTAETWREATRQVTARHEAEIGHLKQQNAQVSMRLKILETFFEKLTADDGPLAQLEQAAGVL